MSVIDVAAVDSESDYDRHQRLLPRIKRAWKAAGGELSRDGQHRGISCPRCGDRTSVLWGVHWPKVEHKKCKLLVQGHRDVLAWLCERLGLDAEARQPRGAAAELTAESPVSNETHERLDALARQINDECSLLRTTVVERAVKIGCLLADAKESCPHGQFLAWVESETSVDKTSANKYIAIATYFSGDRLGIIPNFDFVSALSLARDCAKDRINEDCERAVLAAAERGALIDKSTLDQFRDQHGCAAGDWTAAAQVAALPTDVYRVLVADPPWQYRDSREGVIGHTGAGASSHYPTMPTDAICNMVGPDGRTVRELAAPDSVLFLWATVPLLPDALRVVEAWGFTYKTSIVWDKVRPYVGNYTSVGHEYLLLATRGSCTPDTTERPYSIFRAERSSRHSEKPAAAFELIERLYPDGPRVELFARSRRDGWDGWGNELVAEDAA